jgi:hypothetical protein
MARSPTTSGRAILDEVALGKPSPTPCAATAFAARHMLFIVVDARTGFDRHAQLRTLGIKKVMDAVVSATSTATASKP